MHITPWVLLRYHKSNHTSNDMLQPHKVLQLKTTWRFLPYLFLEKLRGTWSTEQVEQERIDWDFEQEFERHSGLRSNLPKFAILSSYIIAVLGVNAGVFSGLLKGHRDLHCSTVTHLFLLHPQSPLCHVSDTNHSFYFQFTGRPLCVPESIWRQDQERPSCTSIDRSVTEL